MTKKYVVYTAIFGGFDTLNDAPNSNLCDFVCFTDRVIKDSKGWQILRVDTGMDPAPSNRFYKFLAHLHFASYTKSMYVDGNVKLCSDPAILFEKYCNSASIALPKHQDRNDIIDECHFCLKNGMIDIDSHTNLISQLAYARFKTNVFFENNIIIRKLSDRKLNSAFEELWSTYSNGTVKRDQLLLLPILESNGVIAEVISDGPRVSHEFFKIVPHAHNTGWLRYLIRLVIARKRVNFYYWYAFKLVMYLSKSK